MKQRLTLLLYLWTNKLIIKQIDKQNERINRVKKKSITICKYGIKEGNKQQTNEWMRRLVDVGTPFIDSFTRCPIMSKWDIHATYKCIRMTTSCVICIQMSNTNKRRDQRRRECDRMSFVVVWACVKQWCLNDVSAFLCFTCFVCNHN